MTVSGDLQRWVHALRVVHIQGMFVVSVRAKRCIYSIRWKAL